MEGEPKLNRKKGNKYSSVGPSYLAAGMVVGLCMAKIHDRTEGLLTEPASQESKYRSTSLSINDLKNKIREEIVRPSEVNSSNAGTVEAYQELLELLDTNPNQARLLLELSEGKVKTR